MKNRTKVLALFVSIVLLSSCETETYSNPVIENEDEAIVVEDSNAEEDILMNTELKSKLSGSWSNNAQPGQIDFNDDGTYQNCEFYNTTEPSEDREICLEGTWSVQDDMVILSIDGDTTMNSVTWVFDNVVYLGSENEVVNKEEAWEQGMTKL